MKRQLLCGVASALSLAAISQAHAAGTTAGTNVTNQASIGYSVSGVPQTVVNSTPATFVVDRRVNLTVAEVGSGGTPAPPKSTRVTTAFTVTNTTNAVADFRLTATQANGGATPHSDTDNFDVTNVGVFVDVNENGTYEPLTDTATYLDELAADDGMTVFIVADVPDGRVDGDTAGVILTAIAADAGVMGVLGDDAIETSGADNLNSIDTVFGDGQGHADLARDGKFSGYDEFDVASATITLTKTSKVISDPHNGTSNPKAIPGAVVEYCIRLANTGSVKADGVALTDLIPTNTTYRSESIVAGGTVTSNVCNADGVAEDDNNLGLDESGTSGGEFNGTAVKVNFEKIEPGTTVTARFSVSVN